MNLEAILKSRSFNILFSFLMGVAIMAIVRPICRGPDCIIMKAPNASEINSSTYQIGSKCYQFRSEAIDCPKDGKIVEAFSYPGAKK